MVELWVVEREVRARARKRKPSNHLPNDEEVSLWWLVPPNRCSNKVVIERRYRLSRFDVTESLEGGFVGALEEERFAEVELRDERVFGGDFAVIVDEDGSHADVGDDGWVLLLSIKEVSGAWRRGGGRGGKRTEYSHSKNGLVSLSVMSVICLNASPSPFLIFLPCLSFLFLAVRFLVKVMGTLAGN